MKIINNVTPDPTGDMDAEDLRIETAAARETALRLTLDWRLRDRPTAPEVLARAGVFEAFLLAHPAAGQQALEEAHKTAMLYGGDLAQIMATAEQYEGWLSGRVPTADLMPRLLKDGGHGDA